MKWRFSRITILLLVVLSLVPGIVGEQAGCDVADRLYKEGKYEEALATYTALLRENTQLKCAQEGRNRTIIALHAQKEQFYELGKVYELSGQSELAQEVYNIALKKDLILVEAHEVVVFPSDDDFVAEGTAAKTGFLERVAGFLGDVVGIIGTLIKIIMSFLFGVLAIKTLPKMWLRMNGPFAHKPYLNVESFDRGATELGIGKGLEAIIEQEVMKAMDQRDNPSVHLVEGPIKSEVPAEIKSFGTPSLKLFFELIERTFPSKVINLYGYLQRSKDCGAGLTLKLVDNQTKEMVSTCTIWEKDYSRYFNPMLKSGVKDPTPYYWLAKQAASWIYFRLVEHEKTEEGKEKELISNLGTDNCQSYVYLQTGINLAKLDDKNGAQKMYLYALDKDTKNRYALIDLAYIVVEEAMKTKKQEKYELVLKILQKSVDFSETHENELEWLQWIKGNAKSKHSDNTIHGDNVWYKAKYQIAAVHSFMKNWDKSAEIAKALLEGTKATKEAINGMQNIDLKGREYLNLVKSKKKYIKSIKYLRKWLKEIELPVVILYATRLAGAGKLKEAEDELIKNSILVDGFTLKEELMLNYSIRYNIACYYSVLGNYKMKGKNEERRQKEYDEALKHLKLALWLKNEITSWAETDPDLEGVRTNRQTKKEFEELIKKYKPATQPRKNHNWPIHYF